MGGQRMKPLKMAAMTLVASAGLALVSAQAFAATDCGASSACTSMTSAEISAGVSEGTSSTSVVAAKTEGTGTAGTSSNDGSTIDLGALSSTGSAAFESEAAAFGLNHSSTWEKAGGSVESSSGGSGESLAAVFVFGQNIVVDGRAELTDESGAAKKASIDGSFGSVAGQVAFNQTDGVGNQQANLFATAAELNGSTTGPNSGSNALNVTDAQNIVLTDNAEVSNEPYVHSQTCIAAGNPGAPCATTSQTPPPGDLVSVTGSFGSVAGSLALNQSTGVANQQVNSILLAH
jgi:hypothetical protein